jgi:two-component sensor histidine kinase
VQEKEMLLAEVNHRAKNSLTIASSLLSIQGRRQDDPHIQALFQEACDRIMAMAKVHDLLSRSESSQIVALSTYLADLCRALHPITGRDKLVQLESDVDASIFVHADVAIPLGIIATELITNAVKYAFPSGGRGQILVRASRAEGARILLIISDDGQGMVGPKEGSLGYGLVEALVRQIKGEMIVDGLAGVAVTISFPSLQTERVRVS